MNNIIDYKTKSLNDIYKYDLRILKETKDIFNNIINCFLREDGLNHFPKNKDDIKENLNMFMNNFNDEYNEILKYNELNNELYKKHLDVLILICVDATDFLSYNFIIKNKNLKCKIPFKRDILNLIRLSKYLTYNNEKTKIINLIDLNQYIIKRLNPNDFYYRLTIKSVNVMEVIVNIFIVILVSMVMFLIFTIVMQPTYLIVIGIAIVLLFLIICISKMVLCEFRYLEIKNECLRIKEIIRNPTYDAPKIPFMKILKMIFDKIEL